MDKGMARQMIGRMDACVDGWKEEGVDGWVNGCKEEGVDG